MTYNDVLTTELTADEAEYLEALDELLLKIRRERREYFDDVPLNERTGI